MARTFNGQGRAINAGQRIALSRFCEPIVVLRMKAEPSQEDTSWVRTGIKLLQGLAAVDEGERILVAGEHQKDSELFLFVLHSEPEHEFTTADYVIWGDEVFKVQGFVHLGGNRGYTQINTRPWAKLQPGEFTIDPDADVEPPPTDASRENLFWDDLPPVTPP